MSFRLADAAARPGPGPGQRPGEFRARAALARHAADLRVLEQAAEVRFQRLHTPYLDNQVVRACRALPESLRVRPGARAEVLRTVLEGAGVTELPTGWGAPEPGAAATAARTGLRVAMAELVALFDTPSSRRRGWSRRGSCGARCAAPPTGTRCPSTGSPNWSPWSCGCGASPPAGARAGPAPRRGVSGPCPRESLRRSAARSAPPVAADRRSSGSFRALCALRLLRAVPSRALPGLG